MTRHHRRRAALCGLLCAASMSMGLAQIAPQPDRQFDAILYARVLERMRAGEPFYPAYADELRRAQYPIASVLGWRTPALYVTLASVPPHVATWTLRLLALIAVGAGAFAVGGPPLQRFAAGALLLGALGSTWDATAPGYTESWAAVLVTGSVAAYLIRRPLTGATLGIVAVFIRELVVPYVAVCGVLALLRRRTSEALLWAVAGLAYVCYYAAHMRAVRAHQLPADATLAGPWTQGGDLAFLLLTLRANLLFFELPVVLLAAIALLGLVSIGWRSIPRQVSVSLLVYAVLFVWAGHPSRLYWGTLTAPLWAFAVVLCTSAFIAAVSARSTRRRSRPDAAV